MENTGEQFTSSHHRNTEQPVNTPAPQPQTTENVDSSEKCPPEVHEYADKAQQELLHAKDLLGLQDIELPRNVTVAMADIPEWRAKVSVHADRSQIDLNREFFGQTELTADEKSERIKIVKHEFAHIQMWSATGMDRQPATRLLDEGWADLVANLGSEKTPDIEAVVQRVKTEVLDIKKDNPVAYGKCLDFSRGLRAEDNLNAAEYEIGQALLLYVREQHGQGKMIELLKKAPGAARRNDDLPDDAPEPALVSSELHSEVGSYRQLLEAAQSGQLKGEELNEAARNWEGKQLQAALREVTGIEDVKTIKAGFEAWLGVTESIDTRTETNQAERYRDQERVVIPEIKGYVFPDKGTLLRDSDFISEQGAENIPDSLRNFVRPLTIGDSDKGNPMLNVKSTYAMGKAACIEFPTRLENVDYNFIQWKGILSNQVCDTLPQRAGENWQFPFGKEGIAPLFTVRKEPWDLIRFAGAANLEDLLIEKNRAAEIAGTGLRMPVILGTFKFSRNFCEENGLPLPENDDPEDLSGEKLQDFIERNKDRLLPEEYERLKGLYGSPDVQYKSAVLGENVRAFRNIWRVMEVEGALKEKDKKKRGEKISAVLKTSKMVFEKEFGQEFTTDEFIEKFSYLLGEQTAILLKNKLVQGAMKEHKQDVTLAAEICDWDCAHKLDDEYFNDPSHMPDWVKNASEKDDAIKEWVYKEHLAMVRQILLVASNIKPVLEAGQQMGATLSEKDVADRYAEGISKNLSDEEREQLSNFLKNARHFQSIEKMAGKSKERNDEGNKAILDNFEGYQGYFDTVTEAVKANL